MDVLPMDCSCSQVLALAASWRTLAALATVALESAVALRTADLGSAANLPRPPLPLQQVRIGPALHV
jgi:hypothetical protein